MLLASPISWSHHWVWAVPITLLLALRTGRSRWWVAGAWTVVFAARPIWWPPAGSDRELSWTPWQHLVGGSYVLAGLGLAVIAALDLRAGAWQHASGGQSGDAAPARPGAAASRARPDGP